MSLDVDGNCNEKTRTGGAHFFNLMGNFRFIVSLVFTKNLLDRCEPATRALQSSTLMNGNQGPALSKKIAIMSLQIPYLAITNEV